EARRTRPLTPTAPQNGEVVVDHFERQPLLERAVLFRGRSIFAELMPRVIGHSLRSFGANDVMGKRVNYVIRFVASLALFVFSSGDVRRSKGRREPPVPGWRCSRGYRKDSKASQSRTRSSSSPGLIRGGTTCFKSMLDWDPVGYAARLSNTREWKSALPT